MQGNYTLLIDTNTLHSLINAKTHNLRILNSSWYLPTSKQNAQAEVFDCRIASSFFFDIDKVVDAKSPFPHTLPSLQDFTQFMKLYKIRRTDKIVCYDNTGIFTSPRVLWMLKAFGIQDVSVLNGGFPQWTKESKPLDHKSESTLLPMDEDKPDSYNFTFDPSHVKSYEDTRKISEMIIEKKTNMQLVDARKNNRFLGIVPEPRPGLKVGHIPGAINIQFTDVLIDGLKYLPLSEVAKMAASKGIDISKPITFYCGSGVTACVPYLPFLEMGVECYIYIGSWTEYGTNSA